MSSFDTFRQDRIREGRFGFLAVMGEKVSLKQLMKAYNRWAVIEKAKKIDAKEFELLCEDAFGATQGKHEYYHMRVFLDEEELEEFDKEHHYEPLIVNANSETLPPEKLAKSILESAQKEKAIEYLIVLLRKAESSARQTEKLLMVALKQKISHEDYIAKLHKKIETINTLSSSDAL